MNPWKPAMPVPSLDARSAPARGTPGVQPARTGRRVALTASLALAAALTGCGGGLYLTVPIGGYDDGPPTVAVSPLPSFVQPGGVLTLGASASSDWGISQVAFYRIDGSFATFLGADASPPYQWSTPVPGDGRRQVAYFARATDGYGRVADSGVVATPVLY